MSPASSRADWRTSALLLMAASFARIDDGDAGAAALRALMHGVDRDEHGWVADRHRGDAADRGLGVAMPRHVGIVEHDLAPAAQLAGAVGLAFHEAVDQPAFEVLGARALRQIEARIADRGIDAVDVERILHHRMPDAIAAAGAGLVAKKHDLRLGQLDA